MPSNDVIVRTEQLIRALQEIAKASGTAGISLQETEKFLERFVGVNLGSIRESAILIADFSKQVRGLGGDAAQVNALSKSFAELLGKIQATIAMQEKMTALSKAGVATKRLNLAITAGDVGEQQRQQTIIQQAKLLAEQAQEELSASEQIWKRNLEFAGRIEELRAKVMSKLLGGFPKLPSGTVPNFPQLPPPYIALGPGESTGYPTYQAPEYNKLTARNVPLLPAPARQPPKLLPYTTASSAYVPQEQYPSQEFLYQYRQNRMPVIPPPPAQLMSGITDIDNAINERIHNVAKTIPTAPVGPEVNADETIRGAGVEKTGPAYSKRAQDVLDKSVNLSKKQFQDYGLSAQAADNLSKSLENLGMTSGRIVSATTEMSTGITTVSVQAKGAGEVIQNFTAHLDKNGNVLQDTQKRFRSFGSAIMRDVVEVLKWTIAITAIYTPIRKLGEMLEQMKKIQLDMVDVQIVLGDSTQQFSTVLEASAQIATQTSSTLEGVIQGYSLAAAASASAGDEMARTVTTQTLLKDSMVLSKLANIDQKQSLDTLVGSLSQLGMKLTDGTQLLDSWVAVSKKANVSVKDMATSFTIVGSAAEEAGLSYNELNALIGALAQSTNLSSDELGNAIRGIIAAMQTDKAQTEFAKYGIATKNVAGDFRDLMDILTQLKQMSSQGLIDEKAMGALMQAGGAGARRGAQLSAIVQNLDKVSTLTAISESASGDAAKAMKLEMGTLDAATTRLSNAFSELSVTLGGEGGVLGFLTLVTNILTSTVKGVKDLTSALKGAAPVLATFMIAKGILATPTGAGLTGKNIPISLANAFLPASFLGLSENPLQKTPITGNWKPTNSPIMNWILGKTRATGIGASYTGQKTEEGLPYAQTATIGQFAGGIWNRINRPFFPAPNVNGVQLGGLPFGLNKMSLGTLLGPLAIAGANLAQGGPGSKERAGIASGVGLLTAALTGSGVWATIGAMIATSFYDKFMTYKGDIATGLAVAMENYKTPPPPENETPEERTARISKEAKTSLSTQEITAISIQKEIMNLWTSLGKGGKNPPPKVGFEETALGIALSGGKNWLGAQVMDEETIKKVLETYNNVAVDTATKAAATVVPETQQTEIAKLAATASSDIMSKAITDMSKNVQGSIQNYIDSQSIGQKLASTVTNLINAQMLLAQPITVPGQTQSYTPIPGYKAQTPAEATKFVSGLTSEERDLLVAKYTEITDNILKIKELNDQIAKQEGVPSDTQKANLDAYLESLKALTTAFPQLLSALQQSTKFRDVENNLLPVLKLPAMSPQQYANVEKEARAGWMKYFEENNIPPDVAKAWIAAQQEYIVQLGQNMTPLRTTIPIEWFTPPIEAAGIGQQLNIQDMSNQLTKSQFDQMMATAYPQLKAQLERIGYQPQEDPSLMIFKDGAETAHIDNTILQLLMRDLIDVEKEKGLQGMYNLPSGATFYVPVTAYEMSKATVTEMAGGGGGLGDLSELIHWLEQIANNTAKTADSSKLTPGQQQRQNVMERERERASTQPNAATVPPQLVNSMTVQTTDSQNLLNEFLKPENQPAPPVPTNLWQSILDFLSKMPGTTPETTPTPEPYSEAPDWLKNLFGIQTPNSTPAPLTTPTPEAPTITLPTPLLNWFNQQSMLAPPISATNATQVPDQRPINTALNLAVDSTITLTVDGRTLATIIKPYLYQDLIRFNTSSVTSISKSVIA